MPGIIGHRVPGYADQRAQRQLIGHRQRPRHRRQGSLTGQDSQVPQRVGTRDHCAERRSARQRVHPHRDAGIAGAGILQHMPGGHQHARRDLETRPHRGAVTVQHPPQVSRHPPVRAANGGRHDDPAGTPGGFPGTPSVSAVAGGATGPAATS